MELKVLQRFNNLIDAEIIKGVLEENGVACMMSNSVIPGATPFEVNLLVRDEDLDLARQILDNPAPENQ